MGMEYVIGSTSVAAGFEFLGDVLASILVLAGMILAAKPPDAEHPYGHGGSRSWPD
jgi:divalent metal cation (Fe/Co/Zn/Cd) transporter